MSNYMSDRSIYEVLNDAAREVGIDANLSEKYSTFADIREVFETLMEKVDHETRRKIQLEYRVYVANIQYNKNNDQTQKEEISSRDLASIIRESEEKEIKRNPDSFERETDDMIRFVNANSERRKAETSYKLHEDRTVKNTKNLNTKKNTKKIVRIIVALGVLCTVAVYSGTTIYDNFKATEPTTVVDVQSDYGEYDLIDYTIKSGDFSKDIIAKRLGTTPDQIVIVGELSKQAGDTVQIKVYDRLAADDYNYYNKPVVEKTYYAHIDSGQSIYDVASIMMADYPELESYYFGMPEEKGRPVNILVNDLVADNTNVRSNQDYLPGDIELHVTFTKAMADQYGIKSDVKNR